MSYATYFLLMNIATGYHNLHLGYINNVHELSFSNNQCFGKKLYSGNNDSKNIVIYYNVECKDYHSYTITNVQLICNHNYHRINNYQNTFLLHILNQ